MQYGHWTVWATASAISDFSRAVRAVRRGSHPLAMKQS